MFAGTEYGVFVSFDDGKEWKPLQQNLPVTPITDLKIHRNDIVLSTMGRGFWILDNISTLSQFDPEGSENNTLFKPKNTYRFRSPTGSWNSSTPNYPSPSVKIDYYLAEKPDQPLRLEIKDEAGKVVYNIVGDTTKLNVKAKVIRDMATVFLAEYGAHDPWQRPADRLSTRPARGRRCPPVL